MSDIGLPDFVGQDLGIDLEKGIFVRKGKKSDNDSNDSGNNSMNTNGSGKNSLTIVSPFIMGGTLNLYYRKISCLNIKFYLNFWKVL